MPPEQEPHLHVGLKAGGSSGDLRTQSSLMLQHDALNRERERQSRQVLPEHIQIEEAEAHLLAMARQPPAPASARQRSMSLGAQAAQGQRLPGPRGLDVSKEPEELLAGEISRIHAVVSGSGSELNRLNMAYAQAGPSSHSYHRGSFNLNNATQTSLSGQADSVARA